MCFGKALEETDVETAFASRRVAHLMRGESAGARHVEAHREGVRTHERRELIVVSHEDERICEAQGAETRREGYLGSFVDDADVKTAAGEDWPEKVRSSIRCSGSRACS